MLTALVGTTIAPWQFFYLQAGFVEKRVGPRQYKHARMDVLVGSISCMVIVFFIIVCCAATLNMHGLTEHLDAAQARAGAGAAGGEVGRRSFSRFGLLNASLFAASILPLSTAHVICEGLGFEAGLDHKFKEAPDFYSLYTGLIVVGGGHHSDSQAPLWKILVLSQVANGVWLPVVLIFILLLINRRDLMGEHTNTLDFNIVAWATSIIMIILTLVLVYAAIFQPGLAPGLAGQSDALAVRMRLARDDAQCRAPYRWSYGAMFCVAEWSEAAVPLFTCAPSSRASLSTRIIPSEFL